METKFSNDQILNYFFEALNFSQINKEQKKIVDDIKERKDGIIDIQDKKQKKLKSKA